MTLIDKMTVYIQSLEDKGMNISNTSSTRILQYYYRTLGVAQKTTFTDWLYGVAKGKYPAYGSVTRAIRQCRLNTPRWSKKHTVKTKQIKDTKEEVGYGRSN